MSPFDWWVLIVGLVAGGAIVAVLSADLARHDEDLAADEREAEASFIAAHLRGGGGPIDRDTVGRVLQTHREYLHLPTPDAIVGSEPADVREPPATSEPTAASEASTGD